MLSYLTFFDIYLKLYVFCDINSQPDLGWMRRLQQVLGRKHQRNLHVCDANYCIIYLLESIFTLWSDLSIC